MRDKRQSVAKVSILTSVKGTARFLQEMISSVVGCGVNYEIQIRANGLEEWGAVEAISGNSHIYRTFTQHTMPLSDSLNDLTMLATGDLVMRLDPDDLLPPRALQGMVDAHYNTEDIVYGNYVDFGGSDGLIFCRMATREALWKHSVGPYNFLISRDFALATMWKEVGYEDRNMYIRLMANGGVPKPMDFTTLFHRVRPDGRLNNFMITHEERQAAMRRDNVEWFEGL